MHDSGTWHGLCEYEGITPLSVDLKRSSKYDVTIEKDGYETFTQTLKKRKSGYIFFGGLIGIVVDVITGSVNKFHPEEIDVQLELEKHQ